MKSMNSMAEKLMGRMFRPVQNVVWDLMSGKLGVKTKDGDVATIDGTGDDASININPFEEFGVAIPAFAQSTPVDSVKEGDLIYTSGEAPGWIIGIKTVGADDAKKKSFRLIRPGGNISSWVPPKVQMFGLDSGVLVVRNLLNILPNGDAGLTGLQSNLLPLMMLSGGDGLDFEKIMPLMLMGQLNGGGGGGNNMMQMLLMSKLLGGDSGGLFTSTKRPPFRE